ncbi:hypothetical protein HPB51_028592 [Rhipicephalus microplus]|uniref:Uncharacterized protein n=1 Tax=Rhipicephalus microplus TaxID=6941 RepID=A0A9J6CX42_RHIMP|nr:hypothetical protein HPB51_028592 [Rhipicephalus microplus]
MYVLTLKDHFTADQFEPILLRKFGTKKLKRDAAPTIFSQEHLQTSECNDSARSSCGLNLLLTAAALVDEAKETHCPSAKNVLLTPTAVDGYGANSDATQAGLGSSEDAPSSSECDALPACSAGVETTHESSCQPFQALTVPVESQQNFCAACGGFLSAEGTADVTGSSSSSWDADQAVVAALHKRIATLEECLNNMKRKVATLQQQKSRANRRNHELTRNIKNSLLQLWWTCWVIDTRRRKVNRKFLDGAVALLDFHRIHLVWTCPTTQMNTDPLDFCADQFSSTTESSSLCQQTR